LAEEHLLSTTLKMTLFYYIGIKDKITSPHAKEKNSNPPFADIERGQNQQREHAIALHR
jgi:hypothetical protein